MANPYYEPETDPDLEALLRAADAVLDDRPEEENDPFDIQLPPEVYGEELPPKPAPAVVAYNADRVQPRYAPPEASRVRVSPQPEGPRVRVSPAPSYNEAPEQPRVRISPASSDAEEPAIPQKPKKTRKQKKRRRKRRKLLITLILLAALILTPVIWFFTYIQQPQLPGGGVRKDDCSTILLCGTDASGSLTDTMMLFSVNIREKRISLVSLPRDTVTRTAKGSLAKLNSAYARNGSGEKGMEGLMDFVEEIVGFRPDGYMLIDLNCFVEIVNLMGGVEFDVPMDMYYSDPEQDLYIDLEAGPQTLNGYDAMCLVRFRKGYATQDLGRVDIQRQVLAACMDQWLNMGNVFKMGKALDIFKEHTITNLSDRNLLWLAQAAVRCGTGNLRTETLPGEGRYIDGVSYYVLDRQATCDLVNNLLNPYQEDVNAADLKIIN